MSGTFFRHRLQNKPRVSYSCKNHHTCVTHVSWCMSGSLTHGGGESVPSIPGACATRNFTYLIRSPWKHFPHHRPFMVSLRWPSASVLLIFRGHLYRKAHARHQQLARHGEVWVSSMSLHSGQWFTVVFLCLGQYRVISDGITWGLWYYILFRLWM